jgi:hypothetical protein
VSFFPRRADKVLADGWLNERRGFVQLSAVQRRRRRSLPCVRQPSSSYRLGFLPH